MCRGCITDYVEMHSKCPSCKSFATPKDLANGGDTGLASVLVATAMVEEAINGCGTADCRTWASTL